MIEIKAVAEIVGERISRPRAAGSSTLRFTVDLPANQLGPGWHRKVR